MDEAILPIGMEEMNRIFKIVDELEVSREAIQVDLLPAGEGQVEKLPSGKVRIVLPESGDLSPWLRSLAGTLEKMGLAAAREDS